MEVEIILEQEVESLLDSIKNGREFREYERIISSHRELINRTEFLIYFLMVMYGNIDRRVVFKHTYMREYLRKQKVRDFKVIRPFLFDERLIEGMVFHEIHHLHKSNLINDLLDVYDECFDVIGVSYDNLIEEAYHLLLRISKSLFLENDEDGDVDYVIYEDEGDLICVPLT